MARSKAEKQALVHQEAMQRFSLAQPAAKEQYEQSLTDIRFVSNPGAMWEGLRGEKDQRPRIEINKIQLSLIRQFNEYRNNRITVDFISRDGQQDSLADACDGLYRADEQDSFARQAYDNCFEEGTTGGFGAWRLRADYEDEYDEDNEYQRIKIEPIYEACSSVFFDPGAQKYDKSDANFAFVLKGISIDEYKEQWDDDPASWPKDIEQQEFDWYSNDLVYIAEYYKKEEKIERVTTYTNPFSGDHKKVRDSDLKDNPNLEDDLMAKGWVEEKSRKIKICKVRKYIMSGSKVLEDCGYIAGRYIPIIPFYGKRWYVDGKERFMGHVRLAKDPQRLYNMQISGLAEIAATSNQEKPIFSPEQIDGFATEWRDDPIENYSYLRANPIMGPDGEVVQTGPMGYTKPSTVNPAMAALIQITDNDIKEVLGNQQIGEEMQPNMSGKAIEMVQNRLDMHSYIYMDNMATSMRYCGDVWLSMAKDVYIEPGRHMKRMSAEGKTSMIELNKPKAAEDGEIVYENDLTEAMFDVVSSVGPSSESKRAAIVRSVTGMMSMVSDPTDMKVLLATAMRNVEGEGASEIREYYRKQLVDMGVEEPTEEDRERIEAMLQESGPSAQEQALQAMAQEAEAKAANERAKTIETVANAELKRAQTEKTEAETLETVASIERDDMKAATEVINGIRQAVPIGENLNGGL